MASPRRTLNIIWIVAGLFYLGFILGTSFIVHSERYFTLVDDAMISMRYAKHLAQGHGFVWNIGEKPVEGFTNLGWTLVMAFFHLFPFAASKISLAIMLLSLVILLANIAVVYRITEFLLPDSKYAPVLAAIVTAFYFPLVFWSLRGMEVGLLTLLVNCALWLAISRDESWLTGLVLALAILVRIDAAIAAGVILLYLFVKNKRAALASALLVTLAIASILWFQSAYFGDLLPTTYYQKMTGYTLWERVEHGILIFNEFGTRDILPLLLVSLAGLFFYRQGRSRELLLLLGIFIAQCAYSIYTGGDYAETETNAANRFITQGLPALIILFSMMIGRLLMDLKAAQPDLASPNPRANPAIPLALMVLLVISGEPWFNYAIGNAPLLKADIRRVRTGLHIAENTSPEAVIAVHAAGQIPYFSERTTIDLLGLNDPLVAKGRARGEFYPGHNKWNYEYSIGELLPDLIADNFAPFGGYIRTNENYTRLQSDIYVRTDSTLVDVEGLAKDYK